MERSIDGLGQPQSSLKVVGAPAPRTTSKDGPVDSYDQDLTWIVEKLAERVGGDFGVMCRYLALEPAGSLLAAGKGFPAETSEFVRDVIAATRVGADGTGGNGEDLQMVERKMVSGAESYRVLILSFFPSASVNIVAAVFRKDGFDLFGALHYAMARMYYPVLSRYVRLWWMHREERSRAVAFQAALDISDVGIILLDRKLELMFENARARELLDRRCGIWRTGKYIATEMPHDGMKLQAALQHSLNYNLAQERPAGRQPAPLLTLQRGDGERSLIVTVLGLNRTAMDARDAAVLLYVIDPSRDFSTLIAPLCGIYNLTKVETRLAYLLTTGLTLAAAADTMAIQEATARSYLKQIFVKTGTNRQADLMRLMLCSLHHITAGIELEPQ